MQETRLATCEGKVRQTRERAKLAAKKMRKKGEKVEAYRCPYCRTWHVGAITLGHAETWTPRPDKGRDRPTPQRRQMGEWVWVTTDAAGARAARDMQSHPIDRLEHASVIDNDQASAGRDFEQLVRSATQTPQTRDSCLTWVPKGFESDDGNVRAVQQYRALCRQLGMLRERRLQWVCVEGHMPRREDIGILREDLNEAARFFGIGRRG